MSPSRLRRTAFSWIALLAILAVTFAPALSSAWSASRGLPWDAVCSTVAKASSTTDGQPAAPHSFEHCPYCALHADLAPPPDPRVSDAGAAIAFRATPAAFIRAPSANAVWASAQPRAPPFVA